MNVKVKPIQAAPELSGEDARRILEEALIPPTKETIEENEMIPELYKKVRDKWKKGGDYSCQPDK